MGRFFAVVPRFSLAIALSFAAFFAVSAHAAPGILTDEEIAWLASRSNTIVVYPEKNNPPFSYQTASGALEGLSVDYIELVAKNIGVKIHYATPRSRSQLLADITDGRGDVILSLSPTPEHEKTLLFTDAYAQVPVMLAVRKDFERRSTLSPADFNGKKLAMVDDSAVESFMMENYPRVVIETVSDNEVGLQQLVLGEVDGAAIDIASLSFLLSKQISTSVKAAGNTGLDYTVSFAVPKDKRQLQVILEKGLSQISTTEREEIAEKWVSLPNEADVREGLLGVGSRIRTIEIGLALLGAAVITFSIIALHRKRSSGYFSRNRRQNIGELKEEMSELEATNRALVKEMEAVHKLEEDIQQKLQKFGE